MGAVIDLNFLGNFSQIFTLIGTAVSGYYSVKLLLKAFRIAQLYLFNGILGPAINLKKCGEWAVVTGATDGIGKAYAHELARIGMNVVLISRTYEKLLDVGQEIEAKHKVKTKVIAADFTKPDIYDSIIRPGLDGLDIGILVNNVGMAYQYPEYFTEITNREKFFLNMIHCNMTSVTMMTSIVLPGMVEKKKGVIVNVSSASGAMPTPLLSVYSATKVYVDFFSQGLRKEYESKGITIQCVMPFFVATKLSGIRRSNFMAPTPKTFVEQTMATIGRQGRTFGCLSHALQSMVTLQVPEDLHMTLSKMILSGPRAKALKKIKAQQKKE
ncbi:very-long-chain 3-oxoacyl-CoA reductase-like [Tubulanus polymorphus]|uniref:very-long-chain 3-oxoacyl-CoA reductase-like n=1 Tax=Tubulanus polymorphus TaxID=672921 RepID=UPI003DA2AFD0